MKNVQKFISKVLCLDVEDVHVYRIMTLNYSVSLKSVTYILFGYHSHFCVFRFFPDEDNTWSVVFSSNSYSNALDEFCGFVSRIARLSLR